MVPPKSQERTAMVKNKTRKIVYVDNKMLKLIEDGMDKADTDSFSEFTNNAIKFYIGFLNTEKAERYLNPVIRSMMTGVLGSSEKRLARMCYHGYVLTLVNQVLINKMLQRWNCGVEDPDDLFKTAAEVADRYFENYGEEE